MAERIPGVVVTYYPDDSIADRLAEIRREVEPMLLVDNTTDAEARDRLRRLAVKIDAIWLPQPTNRGTAGALNAAFSRLVADGFEAAIVFDQDSTPAEGLAAELCRCARARPQVAVVGSNWLDAARPHSPPRHVVRGCMKRRAAKADLDRIVFVIASGSWFSLLAWRQIGSFDERLFLDLVDTEYCLRAARSGWLVRLAADAHLLHRRGSKRPIAWCGLTWWPANMPPARLHLITRNRVFVLRKYGLSEMRWACFELQHTAYLTFCALVLERQSRAKLRAMLTGIWDGLLQRLGPPEWASGGMRWEDKTTPVDSRTE